MRKTMKGKTMKGQISKRKNHSKRHSRRHWIKKRGGNNIQKGGGFSFTGVLASVFLSVGSVMGLKQSGMF